VLQLGLLSVTVCFKNYPIGAFPGLDLSSALNRDLIKNNIDCPGEEGQTEVCAATAGPFSDPEGWVMFFHGQGITFNGGPKFEISYK
jgi:hypothetical protein